MRKTFICLFLLIVSVTLIGCGGGGAGGANNANINTTTSAVSLLLIPSRLETQNVTTFSAEVHDQNGNAVANMPVTFTISSGTGSLTVSSASTSASGIAVTTLTSTQKGFVTVRADAQHDTVSLTKSATVFFTQSGIQEASMALDIDGNGDGVFNQPADFHLQTDGVDMATVQATLYDVAGLPVSLRSISFTSDSSAISFPNGTTAITNAAGQASVEISAAKKANEFTTNFLLLAYDPASGAHNMITVFLDPVEIGTVLITAAPLRIAQQETSQVTIKAFYTTGTTPPDGTIVALSSSLGTIDPFVQLTSGAAQASFASSGQVGNAALSATVGGITAKTTVAVYSTLAVTPPSQSVVSISNPGSNPASVAFTVTGGIPPYTVSTNNPSVASPVPGVVTQDGGLFVVDPAAVNNNTSVIFTVTDAKGAQVQATLVIGAVLAVNPPIAVVKGILNPDTDPSDDVTYAILGGVPPYVISSNDPALASPVPATVMASGGTFMTDPDAVTTGTTVIFTITDTNGVQATATLKVTP